MMTGEQYWATVAAAFTGTGVFAILLFLCVAARQWIERRTDKRREAPADEPVDEGKLRVVTRRSVSETPPQGVPLFEPARAREPQRFGPPMIEGLTLFAYLKHHAPLNTSAATWDTEGLGVWASVVEDFYRTAGADPRIRHHFEGVHLDELKRHFIRALVTLANTGITVEQADDLGRKHWHLAITEEEYDATTAHLVQTLRRYLDDRAFNHVLPQLSPAVQALRMRIVRPAQVVR